MKQILFENSIIVKDVKKSFLSASASAAGTTITVDSIEGFAVNKILCIGEIGNEKTEIVNTHASTAPSGSTVTLASALTFAHSQGTAVYIIDWDQIEISHATTATGEKTVLTTIDIQADQNETQYSDSTKTSGFYFTRLKDSINTTYSDYTDPIPFSGYESNRVGNIINYALKRNKLKSFTEFVDFDFCIEEINSCLKYITGKLKKWTKLQEFDYELVTATRGIFNTDLPTTIWNDSFKSFLDVRVNGNVALIYKDKREFNDLMYGAYRTTASAASIGDTTLTVTDALHFLDDGTVMVNGVLITYTAKSGNDLTGIPATGTGSITANITAGDNVWQGSYEEGTPTYYTVYSGKFYWYPMTSSATPSVNIVADFWKEAPSVDTDYDEIDFYRYDLVKHWLTWAIRMQLKNDGIRDLKDGDYIQFEVMLQDAIKGEIHGQKYKYRPNLNTITY